MQHPEFYFPQTGLHFKQALKTKFINSNSSSATKCFINKWHINVWIRLRSLVINIFCTSFTHRSYILRHWKSFNDFVISYFVKCSPAPLSIWIIFPLQKELRDKWKIIYSRCNDDKNIQGPTTSTCLLLKNECHNINPFLQQGYQTKFIISGYLFKTSIECQ